MKLQLSVKQRILITVACFVLAIFGFLIKLPAVFRHSDKLLHSTFYFAAAAFLNVFFARASLLRHALIFCFLYLFGTGIEYAQAWSNKAFHTTIHGRFDPEDVRANLSGLIAFSLCWLLWAAWFHLSKRDGGKKQPLKQNLS